jgi:hypothetical protein
MKFLFSQKIISAFLISVFAFAGLACQSQNAGNTAQNGEGAKSPTEAYTTLYAAVKSKKTEDIKRMMSKKSLAFAKTVSQRQNTPIDKVFENGFTATTFAETMPEIRDERIKDNMGAIEVWNSKDSLWENLPFIKEEDGWKLAVGDAFAGTWKSPGKGLSQIETEAANSAGNKMVPLNPNINGNFNSVKSGNANSANAAADSKPDSKKVTNQGK